MRRSVGKLFAYLNCHVYILFVVFSLWLVNSCLPVIHLFVCSQWLVVAGYYNYYCLFDKQLWQCTEVEKAGSLPLGCLTGSERNCLRYNTCMYILYLRHDDTMLAILCMSLPINTTLASEYLKKLIFQGDICITTNA